MSDVPTELRAARDEIVEAFNAEVLRCGLVPSDMPTPVIEDDVGPLLDRLCRRLRNAPVDPTGPAAKHAETRWQAGVDIATVVREYGVLGRVIIAALGERLTLSPHDQAALLTSINEACAVSVAQYAAFRDDEYRRQVGALRAAEAMRDALIMTAPLGVAFFDRDLRYRVVNDELAAMNGLPASDHLGKTPMDLLPRDIAEVAVRTGREVLAGESGRDIEITGETQATHGEQHVWLEHWYPVRRDGQTHGVAVIVEDVTARKRAEAFRERLLGVVSHDLRNPLAAIMNGAQLVLMQPDLDDKVRAFTLRLLASARRMLGIIEQLYDYVNIDQGGGLPLKRRRIDLAELTRRVIEETSLAFPGRPTPRLDIDGDLHGEWDETRVGQVLSNLVANAIQHGTGPTRVVLRGIDGVVHVEVRNAGRPIPPEMLATIFQPFKSTGDKHHLGLGLFIAREIIRAHGGDIRASSGPETVFAIELPR